MNQIKTLNQFLKTCQKYKAVGLTFDGYKIRKVVTNGHNYCPITYLYLKVKKKFLPTSYYNRAAEKLNIDPLLVRDIVRGADCPNNNYHSVLFDNLCKGNKS